MIYLVTGGSGSGKSEYAEGLIMGSPCSRRYYVATMEVFGEEGRAKVKRHQELRRGKGFITLECRRDVGNVFSGHGPDHERYRQSNHGLGCGPGQQPDTGLDRAVLLECVSNLAANEMFGSGGADRTHSERPDACSLAEVLAEDISCLAAQVKDRVIVTKEVAMDGILYDPETMEYIRLMGLLNQRLAEMADQVVEVVYGIPVWLKRCGNSVERSGSVK